MNLFNLEMKGGVEDKPDFVSDEGRGQTSEHEDGTKQR